MIEIEEFLRKIKGIWEHSEGGPHAELTSGKHSGWFFDVSYAFSEDPRRVEFLAQLLVNQLKKQLGSLLTKATRVISSAMGAIIFGHEVAKVLGIKFAHCDKINNQQVLKRVQLKNDEIILQIEELITTLSTTKKVTSAILTNNPNAEILKRKGKIIVGTLIHRPPKLPADYRDYEIIAVWEREIHTYEPSECPYCQQGSEALRFKENREKFFKEY